MTSAGRDKRPAAEDWDDDVDPRRLGDGGPAPGRAKEALLRLALALRSLSCAWPFRLPSARQGPPAPGLVAAYSFDDGTGTTAVRRVGQRTPRRDRERPVDDGTATAARSRSTAPTPPSTSGLGTFYQQAFTLEAWVQKAAHEERRRDRRHAGRGTARCSGSTTSAAHYQLTLGGNLSDLSRLAAATRRRPMAAPCRDVRRRHCPLLPGRRARSPPEPSVQRRQLQPVATSPRTAAAARQLLRRPDRRRAHLRPCAQRFRVVSDMNQAVPAPIRRLQPAPGQLSATGSIGEAALNWQPAIDDVGVARTTCTARRPRVRAHRREPRRSADRHDLHRHGPRRGTYDYKVRAEDAAGNIGPASNEASAIGDLGFEPPSVSISAPSAGAAVAGIVTVSANAVDNHGVVGVQFPSRRGRSRWRRRHQSLCPRAGTRGASSTEATCSRRLHGMRPETSHARLLSP